MLKVSLLILLFVAFVTASSSTSNLLCVIEVFRHGRRAPLMFYPTDPYSDPSYWSIDIGQLDNVGKQQHYTLGRFTKTRYSDLLTNHYNSSEFYAYTTNVDRTHMSAQANLAALWEPTGKQIWRDSLSWQPIPVHPLDPRVLQAFDACGTFDTLYADAIGNSDLFAELNEQYIDVYQTITDNSGYIVNSVAGVYTIYDTLFIEELNGFTLPSWTESVYPEPMSTLAAYNWMGYSYTTTQKKISAGIFFRDLLAHFEGIKANPSSSYYKFKMYSGHDNDIAAILDTLGAFTPHSPYFASSIYFELRESRGRYFVNIWHKNKDTFEQVTAKGCTVDCNLSLFKVLLADYIIDEDTFDELCNATSSSATSTYALKLTSSGVEDNVRDFLRLRAPRT